MARSGRGKPCGASYISHNKFCRVGLPTHVNEALNRASHEVGIVELINAAKHAGGKGALGKAVAIRQQLRQEVAGAGNLKKGEHGRELKRRLEAAGLLPQKGAPKSEGLGDIFNKNLKPAEPPAKSVPTDLKKELAALAARDQQAENPKTPQKGTSELVDDDISRILRGSVPKNLQVVSAGGETGARARLKVSDSGGSATGNTRFAKQEAADFDKNFKPATRQGGTYDWNETTKPGTKKIGEGSFGTLLMTKGPPPVAVKRGELSTKEAAIIDKVGKADLGPKLIAGELEKGGRMEYGVRLSQGRIAMSVVSGTPLIEMSGYSQVGNTTAANAYWRARADLHRLGIAHNDAHPGNLLIDDKGKGRWVDMGLAHDSPHAALAEALGVLERPRGAVGVGVAGMRGDWQGRGWAQNTGNSDGKIQLTAPDNLKLMQTNHDTKVLPFLRSKGLTDDEIGIVMTHGIRQPPSSYITKPGFNKLTDNDALKAIDLLYDGVK